MDPLTGLAFGAAGGIVLGLEGYFEVWKAGIPFDRQLFVKSLLFPVVFGLVSGFSAASASDAFLFGLLGKIVQEGASSAGVLPKTLTV